MNSLQEYGELFNKLNLTEMQVEEGEFKLKLKREAGAAIVLPAEATPREEKITAVTNEKSKESAEPTDDQKLVKAPLLGIFYPRAGEEKKLAVGDAVKAGDVLCTIEAMKMMNEVKAPGDGVILEIYAKEGDLVEYNQKLFAIG